MFKKALFIILAAVIILPLAVFGCKSKIEKTEAMKTEGVPEMVPPMDMTSASNQTVSTTVVEPSQTIATETIPPTAATQVVAEKQTMVSQAAQDRNKDIQKALKKAGFYKGTVDGKIGPKTTASIKEFQKAKGLKADGKVGPKTWMEMEKYLTQ